MRNEATKAIELDRILRESKSMLVFRLEEIARERAAMAAAAAEVCRIKDGAERRTSPPEESSTATPDGPPEQPTLPPVPDRSQSADGEMPPGLEGMTWLDGMTEMTKEESTEDFNYSFGGDWRTRLTNDADTLERVGHAKIANYLRSEAVVRNQSIDEEEASINAVIEYLDAITTQSASELVSHSTDFRSVRWGENNYSFTANQAPVVRLLYKNWMNRTPDVADETLLMAADHEAPPERLNVLFRDHPAWNTLIVPGGSKGAHRLADPPENNS